MTFKLTKTKKASALIAVFLLSVITMLLYGQLNPEAFLNDDNRTQWFPIIERAYEDFFSTGKMPYYNFFQLKGMNISDPGYYAIINPVMMISYILSNFTPLPFSTMTLHIAIMFGLGNLFFFLLCRVLGLGNKEAVLFTAAYSVSSSCLSYSYWYYVFNNYMFLPLLVLVFYMGRKRRVEYVACGLVLALEILFGNVQYVCYHYMVYGLICLAFFFFDKKRYIKVLLSNVLVAVTLSLPCLLQMMRSSEGFDNDEFSRMSVIVHELIISSLIPSGILSFFGINLPVSKATMGRHDFTWLYNGAISVVLIVMAVAGVRWFLRNRNKIINKDDNSQNSFKEQFSVFKCRLKSFYESKLKRENNSHILVLGLAMAALFFVSFVGDGIVAHILKCIPVINQFRYLFKCIFVIQPLFAMLAVALWSYLPKNYKSVAKKLCVVFVCIGVLNCAATAEVARCMFAVDDSNTLSEEKKEGEEIAVISGADFGSYRYLTLFQDGGLVVDSYQYQNGFIRNFPTTMGIYSLGAYEIAANEEHFEQFAKLYSDEKSYVLMVNCGLQSELLGNFDENAESIEQQLTSNAVKYVFVQTDKTDESFAIYENGYVPVPEEKLINKYKPDVGYTEDIVSAFEMLENISVAEVKHINEYYDLIVLDGVNGLCTDGNNVIPVNSERMDEVSFVPNGADKYTLSFAFEEGLYAIHRDKNGNETELEVSQADDGNAIINGNGINGGTICFSFKDMLAEISIVLEYVIVILFIAMLAILFKNRGKTEV